MTKFKYNHQQNALFYQEENQATKIWYQITEQFQGNFNSLGFNLTSGWMTFTIYEKQIKVFYKQVQEPTNLDDFWTPETIAYHRKYLPKQEEVIFEFYPSDQVEKVTGKWVKKGGKHE
jgi:hypothetical protein